MMNAANRVPVLAMWEPWATLVIKNRKHFETRPMEPSAAMLGQRVVIHACKTRDHVGMCGVWPFDEHVTVEELTFGALIGSVKITACHPTDELGESLLRSNPAEHAFGDYSPGRFAWTLEGPHAFRTPIPYRGHQGAMFIDAELVGMGGSSLPRPAEPAQGKLL